MLSNKTVVLLAAVLLALLAVLRHAGPLLGTGEGDGGSHGAALLSDFASHPSAVRIEANGFSVSLRRAAARWVFAPPDSGRADARRVDLSLDAALHAVPRDRVTPRQREARALGLAAFGLEPPRARIELEGPGWREAVSIGSETPDGTGVYALVDGRGDIDVVDRALFDLLPASPDDFRDRSAFAEPGIEPDELEIRRPGSPAIRLARSSRSGVWRFVEPYDCPADAANLGTLLDALSGATVERFVRVPGTNDAPSGVSADFVANGLGPDDAVLSLRIRFSGENAPADFTFGGPDPLDERVVFSGSPSEGTVFTVDRSVLDALRMPADLLRERRPFPFAPREILSASFRSGDGPFSFGRSDALSPWTITEPAAQPASQEAAGRFLDALLALRDATAEPIRADDPAAPDSIRLDLVPAAPAAPVSARLSRRPAAPSKDGDDPPDLLVDFPERGIRHVVPGAALPPAALSSSAFAALRDPAVLRLDPESVVSLSRRAIDGSESVWRRGADGAWFRDGAAAEDDGAAAKLLSDAIATLCALDASETVALFTPDSAAYGLLPPGFELAVATRDETRPVVILQFGSVRPDGSVHLRVKGEDAVFAIPAEAAAALVVPFER
jgi:hypothetical protein